MSLYSSLLFFSLSVIFLSSSPSYAQDSIKFLHFDETTYLINSTRGTNTEQRHMCHIHRMRLARLKTQSQVNFMYDNLNISAWIGLSCIDGYAMWDDCDYVIKSILDDDSEICLDESSAQGFIFESSKDEFSIQKINLEDNQITYGAICSDIDDQKIEPEFKIIDQDTKKYLLDSNLRNFHESQKFCHSHNMIMAVIHDSKHLSVITENALRSDNWLGIYCSSSDNSHHWIWDDGSDICHAFENHNSSCEWNHGVTLAVNCGLFRPRHQNYLAGVVCMEDIPPPWTLKAYIAVLSFLGLGGILTTICNCMYRKLHQCYQSRYRRLDDCQDQLEIENEREEEDSNSFVSAACQIPLSPDQPMQILSRRFSI